MRMKLRSMKGIMNTQLSAHFSLLEAIDSMVARNLNIPNIPGNAEIEVMVATASKLEDVRRLLNKPMHVNSWYRCPALNRALGSKSTSQHIRGEAVDFICPEYGTPAEVCEWLVANANLIQFDQLILEHTWVHISFAILTGKPKGQVLSLLSDKTYAIGLTDRYGEPLGSKIQIT